MSNTSIQTVIDRLKDRSQINTVGMAGSEVYIEKSTLALAATYLEDYIFMLEAVRDMRI